MDENLQSCKLSIKHCSTFGTTRNLLGFRRQDINTPKTPTVKGTFEEPVNQWQKNFSSIVTIRLTQ